MPEWKNMGPVQRSGSVTLNASGAGTIVFEVFTANSKFEIDTVVVKAAGAAPQLFPQVTLYNGLNQVDAKSAGGSWFGGQVTFRGHMKMDNADDLTVGFASGTSGTKLTAVIEGTNFLWR
jgi:hypothetical protein